MLPSAGVALAADGPLARPGQGGGDTEVLVCQNVPPPSRTAGLLNEAIERYRKGDYEGAANLFKAAQGAWNSLTPVQQADLTRFMQANNTALLRQREAAEQVRQAEKADRAGQGAEALNLLGKALANPNLAPADKQKAQSLADRLRGRTAEAGSGNPAGLARTKLHQARQLLAQGNFDAAEQLAREAERMNVVAGPGEDSPRRVIEDISHMRSDPRALLAAARGAFTRGELDRAEQLARMSAKAEPAWAVHLWGDSPSKVLRDVDKARAGQPAAAVPAPETSQATGPVKEPASVMDSVKGLFTTKKADGEPSAPRVGPAPVSKDQELARQYLQQGRKALREGQLEQARDLATKAAALKVDLDWWDDNPAKLLADVQRAQDARRATAKQDGGEQADKAPTPREDARTLLQKGREAYAAGRIDEAYQLAQKAKVAPSGGWGLFERDTPDKLLKDVEKVRARRDQEEAARLLGQGRQLLEQGDLDGASRAALRAQTLHGPYSVWDLGDRPSKLLEDVENARKKGRKNIVPPVPPTGGVAQNDGAGRWPAGQGPGAAPATPAVKEQARKVLAEARQLQASGKIVEARHKALEAQRLPAAFAPDEDRPEKALIDLAGIARRQIDGWVSQADDNVRKGQTDPRAYGEADRLLAQAQGLARQFQLDTHLIDSKLAWVRQARGQTGVAGNTTPGRSNPDIVRTTVSDGGPQNRGRELLAKARLEIRSGNTNAARRLVEEVYKGPYGLQTEAENMLRSIDTEEFEQRRREARRTFEAGNSAFRRGDYKHAAIIFRSLDHKLLDERQQARLREVMAVPEIASVAPPEGLALAPPPDTPPDKVKAPGTGDSPEANYLKQVQALQELKFQKLREQGLSAQEEAARRFRAGDSDRALEILQEYLGLLPDSGLEADRTGLLRRPVEARLQQYKTLKAQRDFAGTQDRVRQAALHSRSQRELAEQNKQKRIQELMSRYNQLLKESKYSEAQGIAMQALDLDPDNATVAAAVNIAKMRSRLVRYNSIKDEKEIMALEALNEGEKTGPFVSPREPLHVDKERSIIARKRGDIFQKLGGVKTEKERQIEQRLQTPINMTFQNTPLGKALDDLSTYYGLPIYPDVRVLEEAGISLDRLVTIKLENVAMKSGLNLLLSQVGLTWVIADEVLKVTTEENARGKRLLRAFPVSELVIPVESYGSPAGQPLPLDRMPGVSPTGVPGGVAPYAGPGSMTTSGTPTGTPGSGFATAPGSSVPTWTKSGPTQTREDQLIQIITNTIEPRSWASMGGHGTIDYFPMTMTLVINQTPDILEQVADLLNALRRLQDAEVSVELRLISIAEGFFERIGLDFNINIKSDKQTQRFEPLITSGQFKPAGFINDFSPDRFIAGLTPAGTFTSDLDIPIRTSSFGMAIPPFGGFPNLPGSNGGIELGLAFLSDIQVFLFMEAAQGDQRTNVMQAPKLTLFNGQTSTLFVSDQQFFVTNVQVFNNNGQITFIPQNIPLSTGGVLVTIQAVISADRRFVRINFANVTLTNLASAVVPLFPIPVVVTPIFEGGFQGQPVVFTQFIQQPVFNTINISTTVAIPDGGTVLLGGLKRLSEGRNEFGPPVLSKIPYVNRLFKNVGYGREVQNFMMMVTPRIIINEEEEERQTGVITGGLGAQFGGQ
jgi:type II secretory pathway component GspD/PulD (secretin)